MAKSNEAVIQHIDAQGNFVAETDESAAYSVNMNDPNAHNFIESVKKAAGVLASVVVDSQGEVKLEGKKKSARGAAKDAVKHNEPAIEMAG